MQCLNSFLYLFHNMRILRKAVKTIPQTSSLLPETNVLILSGNDDRGCYPVWWEDVTLQDISIDCSYYSASLLKEEGCKLLPLPCSYSHLVPVLSQQSTVAIVTPGPTDWLSHLWLRPHLGCGSCFSECVSCRGQRARWGNEHSDPVTR